MSNSLDNPTPEGYVEYFWKYDGADGLRSYSYNASEPNWNYAEISNPDKVENKDYLFSDSSTGQPYARRGNLYNWTAATLGSSFKATTKNDQTEDSICPKGWQLPMNSDNRSFKNLVDTYGIISNVAGANRIKEWPLEYLPTGNYDSNGGCVANRTTWGDWWSGVAGSATGGYVLNSYSGNINAQDYWNRGQGFALRK